jgi:hypothetical protein
MPPVYWTSCQTWVTEWNKWDADWPWELRDVFNGCLFPQTHLHIVKVKFVHPWGFYKRERWKEKLKGRVSSNCQAIWSVWILPRRITHSYCQKPSDLGKQERQFKSDGKIPSQRAKLNDILQVVKQFYSNGLFKEQAPWKL